MSHCAAEADDEKFLEQMGAEYDHDMEMDTDTAHSKLRRTPRDFKFVKDPGSNPPVKFHYKVGHKGCCSCWW